MKKLLIFPLAFALSACDQMGTTSNAIIYATEVCSANKGIKNIISYGSLGGPNYEVNCVNGAFFRKKMREINK